MKVNQIVGEHKKGMRAKKYARKPFNTIGPKKPEPPKAPDETTVGEDLGSMTNTSGKVIANDGKTITVAMPDGTQIQKPITPDTMATDPQGKPVVNLATQQTMGATQPQQSPQDMFAKGKDITVNTGKPIEEIGGDFMQGVKSALGMQSPEDIAKQDPNGQMAQLLKLRQQYAGTQHSKQIEARIKNLQFRINGGHGVPVGPDGEPKPVLPPEEFAKQNPNFKESNDETDGALSPVSGAEDHDEVSKLLVTRLRKLAGL